MFLTCIWVLLFLFFQVTSLNGVSINAGQLWALIFALIVDFFFYGYVRRQPWYVR